MTTHIHEREMRRKRRIRYSTRLRDVAGLFILETRAHAVAQQHVDRRLRFVISSSLPQEEWTQSMLFRKTVLEGFDLTWRGDRTGDEGNADWFERLRRKCLGGEAGPEAVAIPSDGGKAGDTVVSNEVVDLGALDIRAAVIPATEASIARSWPWVLAPQADFAGQPAYPASP
jgi:hypothetical protein